MLTLVVVAACSSSSTDEPARVFDPCSPLRLTATGATDAQLASIDQAVASWQAVGITTLGRDIPADVVVPISFAPGSPASYGYYDDVAAAILINDDLTDAQRSITIAHELGHALGLVHVPIEQRASVMNAGNLTVVPSAGDDAAVEALWGTCAHDTTAP